MSGVFVDNDVIIKSAAYGFGFDLIELTTIKEVRPAMLSVGRFVARDRLARGKRFIDGPAALVRLEAMLLELTLLEPTDEELSAAADFESAAAKANLELDGGESQLLAILLSRAADLLVTGDKRAIVAIASAVSDLMQGKLACFEQVLWTMVASKGADAVRMAVCSEPFVDKAAAICCGCAGETAPCLADMFEGIESYINYLRDISAGMPFSDNDLSTLAA